MLGPPLEELAHALGHQVHGGDVLAQHPHALAALHQHHFVLVAGRRVGEGRQHAAARLLAVGRAHHVAHVVLAHGQLQGQERERDGAVHGGTW
jgi:hypothetical protein